MAVLLEALYSLILLGSISSKPVGGEVQFNSTYGGKEVIATVGSSLNFTWIFTGDMKLADWGTKTSGRDAIASTLVSLTTSGPGSAGPPPQYAGRVNGIWDGKTSPGRVTFTLNSIRENDAVAYACRITPVSLGDSPVIDTLQLVVRDYAAASFLQNVLVADVDDSSTFICNATGIPAPNITWLRPNASNETAVVHSTSKYDITPGSGISSQLTIKNITSEDHGYYECKASGFGFDVARSFLGVPYLNAREGSAQFRSTKGAMGQQVTLDCPVNGFPQPEVTWTLPNGTVLPNRLVSTLPIILKTDADFGNYTCSAKSLDRTIPHFIINIRDAVSPLKSKVTDGGPAVVEWDAVSGADYYLVKITGDNVHDDAQLGSGNEESVKIHFHTLVLKANEKVKEVQITVQVLALNDDYGLLAKGERLDATVSASVALQATILHLFVVLVQILSGQ